MRLLNGFAMESPLPVRLRHTYEMVAAGSLGNDKPRVFRDCRSLGSGSSELLTSRLLTDINREAVNQYEGFAAHAGVIARDGRAMALPALTKGGKSTLTSACVMAGFGYVSDESLCIDIKSGEVVPYHKPIMLSAESCRLLGIDEPSDHSGWVERGVTANDLGGTAVTDHLKLDHIVFAQYGHDDVNLTPLPASEAVAGLLRLSFNHYKTPADSFRLATSIAATVRTWRLTYDDPQEAAELLAEELG